MPYKWEYQHKKIPHQLDKRIKLTEEDKKKIKDLYFKKGLFIREIARQLAYLCSRRLIQFVIFPERRERAREILKAKGQRYYKRKKHAQYTKKHRRYKQSIKDKLL